MIAFGERVCSLSLSNMVVVRILYSPCFIIILSSTSRNEILYNCNISHIQQFNYPFFWANRNIDGRKYDAFILAGHS